MAININGTGSITGLSSISSPTISGGNFPAGTAGSPGITLSGDADTGLYSPGANQIAIATSGVAALTIDASQRVGVGTTSPAATLHSRADNAGAGSTPLLIQNRSISANTTVGISFAPNTSDTADRSAIIYGVNSSGGSGNATDLTFHTNANGSSPSEKARIDSSGRLLVGTSTSVSQAGVEGLIQAEATSTNQASIKVKTNSNDANPASIALSKSRGTSVGSNTAVQNGDAVGSIYFFAADGTDTASWCAEIAAVIDGTPGSNDVPGRLVFSTTADGASSPTERFRIRSDGNMGFFNTPGVYPNTDNAASLGFSGFRWSAVYAANGTIQTSDQRAKAEIADASLGSSFIKALRPVSYKWIEGGKRDTGERDANGNYIYEPVSGQRTHWGFIAQEVKQAVDAAGVDFGGWVLTDKDDPDSQQALRYDQFIAPLTKALQEALAEIDVLKAKVAALETP